MSRVIDTKVRVLIHEENGEDYKKKFAPDGRRLVVKSHWNDPDMVVISLDGLNDNGSITVMTDDLVRALNKVQR
jgi:hypothetical protein